MSDFGIIASGLSTIQAAIADTAANLANRGTDGYGTVWMASANPAATLARPSRTVLQQTVLNPDLVTGSGSTLAPSALQWSNAVQLTGVPTNLAIRGPGFFVVTPPGGGVAYTRNGAFTLNAVGQLTLPDGSVATGLHRAPAGSQVHISPDGHVIAQPPHGAPVALGTIAMATFANPGGLAPQAGTLYAPTAASGPAQVAPAPRNSLQVGAVNPSGVSIDTAMTALIAEQTAYSANADALRVAGTVAQVTDSLHT